jgi:hypothetical protein
VTIPSRFVEFLRRAEPPRAAAMEPPPYVPRTGEAFCPGKLCDTWRVYDVLPGHPASKLYGAIPSFAFCTHCGEQLDIDLEETA